MSRIAHIILTLALVTGCGAVEYGGSGGGGGDSQVLYLPSPFPLASIDRVTVQTQQGQTMVFGPRDVQQASAGRLAVRLPVGVTTGTVTVEARGQVVSTPFHVAVSMSGALSLTLGQGAACQAIAGTWVGSISGTPGSTSTVVIEPLADCRTIRGFVHLEAPGTGSVDSTIDGQWDASQGRLIARDTQLFNVRARPGSGFCPTERYDLVLRQGGMLTGTNLVTERACAGTSPVQLQRAR